MRFKNHTDFFLNLYYDIFGHPIKYKFDINKILEDIRLSVEPEGGGGSTDPIKPRKQIILMIDEFDSLFSNTNAQIFEIFSLCEFLTLIGISNSMEMLTILKEKFHIVEGKINFNQVRNLVFKPYDPIQMAQIVLERIKEINNQYNINNEIFTDKAVRFCSNIVCHKGGDVRVLLDVCKRALVKNIQKYNEKNKIDINEETQTFESLLKLEYLNNM